MITREYESGDAIKYYNPNVYHSGLVGQELENRMQECYKKITCIINENIVYFAGIDKDGFVFVNFNGTPNITAVKSLIKNIKKFLTDFEYSHCWTSSRDNEILNRWHKFLGMKPIDRTDDGYIIYIF